MSSGLSCSNCGSSELESDSSRGDTVCTRCGSVLEDNLIVADIQFEEGNRGASHIVGQMVSGDTGFKGLSVGGMIGSGKESRQVTLDNARKKIRSVGVQLRLNNHCIDTAFNFYKLALSRRLTHGRKHTHVVAACIYITCRMEGTSHMLLDLSDIMQVNVYELGRTYLKLSATLCINIPAIDPCLYIVRFAHRLDLGEKSHEVEMTALRMVQRMKRDWMHTGRRPSGLCGAALLVAARLHETHCTVKDIIKIVRVCEATIRKRLNEFGETPSSKLTLEEFMTVDLEGEEDPPCFKEAKKKQKNVPLEDNQLLEAAVGEISIFQEQIEKDLEKSRKTRRFNSSWFKSDLPEESAEPLNETAVVEQFLVEQTVETVSEIVAVETDCDMSSFELTSTLRPTASSLGITENFGMTSELLNDSGIGSSQATGSDENEELPEESGELEVSDLDDDELNSYLLSPSEVECKTNIWTRINADYLAEMAEKTKRKALEEAERKEKEAQGELPPKKKRRMKKRQPIQANSAGEAIEKMLQEKRISNKINYDVLKSLSKTVTFGTPDSSGRGEVHGMGSSSPASPIKRLPSIRNILTGSVSNTPTKRTAEVSFSQERETGSSTSNNCRQLPDDAAQQADDQELDYFEEEEEVCEPGATQLSIAQLMGAHRGHSVEALDNEDCYESPLY